MRQPFAWIVLACVLVALLAGGLFSTFAWLYQANNREVPPTVEPGFTPVPAVAKLPATTPAATATTTGPRATATKPATIATKPAATEVPVVQAANVENGRQVYARFCNACHPNGAAGVGPALTGATFKSAFAGDAALKTVIRDGRGTMPAFRQIGDAEMNDLVAFIRTLDKP